jgi:plastocyanin
MTSCSRLVFSAGCAILLVFACMAAGCTSSQTTPAPSAQPVSPAGTSITMKNFAFDPPVLTVKPGTAVTWVNQDGALHTIVFDAGAPASFSSESLSTGASTSFTFTQAGTYAYHCSIHPSMKGTVVVQG